MPQFVVLGEDAPGRGVDIAVGPFQDLETVRTAEWELINLGYNTYWLELQTVRDVLGDSR